MKATFTTIATFFAYTLFSQISGTISTQLNTNCNGVDCSYNGPTILINELMISPFLNDGSISGAGGTGAGRGEWIELFNPNICEPVDISCYYLGNNTAEGNGGFVIPPGTVIPPAGFCMIRGINVDPVPANLLVQNGGNVVEIVVPGNITDPGVCSSGTRVWFPNAGGWFAFYDANGVPQDAVSWINQAGVAGTPCVPTLNGCVNIAALPSYNDIPNERKTLLNTSTTLAVEQSVRRIPDGGPWSTQGPATYATCNATCIQAGTSTCTGSATVSVSGGTPPYTYQWNDSQLQSTPTVVNLCAGSYQVTVTDANGNTEVFTAVIEDFIPTVSVDLPPSICVNNSAISVSVSPTATVGQTGTITGSGISSGNFNPATAGVGTHTVNYYFEDQFGCSNTASDQILVNPLPNPSITNNESPYCLSDDPAQLILSPAGGQLSGNGVTNNQFIPSVAGVGSHTLTYTYQDANGCSNSTSITVQVTASTPPVITAPDHLCVDSPEATISATPTGGSFTLNGNPIGNQLDPAAMGAGSHSLTYQVTDPNGCLASTTKLIETHPLPVLAINAQSHYCFESGIHPVTVNPSGGTLSGDNLIGSSIHLNGILPDTYQLNYAYTDAFGCSNTTSTTYTVTSPLNPTFETETDCFQTAYFVSKTNNPAYNYHWNIMNVILGSGPSFTTTINTPGTYPFTLTVTDNFNCSYDTVGFITIEEGIQIEKIEIPNIITPNGDGINDKLEMPLPFSECFTYRITIVNRWGNLVYRMEKANDFFEGKNLQGDELTDGVYFYYLESDDFDCNDEKFKGVCYGNITLIR